jgi:uncharacterized protein (TIGR03435 family)
MIPAAQYPAVFRLLCLFTAFTAGARAQDAVKPSMEFDVSTIHPSQADARGSTLDMGIDTVTSTNLPVVFLIQFAYNLNSGSTEQIVGIPAWGNKLTYDIRAKADAATTTALTHMSPADRMDALRSMVKAMLQDRFALRTHYEPRQLSVLALRVLPQGPKLIPVNDGVSHNGWSGLHNPGAGKTQGRDATLKMLADALSTKSEIGGKLVVDQTGLKGHYDFDLHWSPQDLRPDASADSASGPSLFTALQEQLGLKLEATKATVDCVVIDHIEQPSPN